MLLKKKWIVRLSLSKPMCIDNFLGNRLRQAQADSFTNS
jgi:hypothetical protein